MFSNISPLISVVTIVYNGKQEIERTINSVLNQRYNNIEYIIIDGGSNDGTIEIINKYKEKISLFISEPDFGIYDAMNKGIRNAKGEFIGIINCGDWYEFDAIKNIVDYYTLNNNASIIHGVVRNLSVEGKLKSILGYSSSVLSQHMIQHPTCFIKKSIYDKYGLYDLKYKSASDYELMLRLQNYGVNFYFLDKILANFTEGGMSSNLNSVKEDYLIKFKYNKIKLIKYSIIYVYLTFKIFLKKYI